MQPVNQAVTRRNLLIIAAVFVVFTAIAIRSSAFASGASELPPGSPGLIQPAELAKAMQSSSKPIVLNVGPRFLYLQAHIPGAEYIGSTADPPALEKLRARAASLPRNALIVIYCGCCPWEHCPNIRPAYRELSKMGFSKLKVLFIANTFGTDWVEKGYPVAKGE